MDGDSWRIYDYVVRHFIGTVSYNCKYQSTTVNFSIGDEKFSFSGKKLIEPGFTAVMTWQALTSEESMPNLQKGDTLPIKEVYLRQRIDFMMELTVCKTFLQAKLSERQTSPPDYLTESDLITLMEKHGIGTDASIPVHINNVCQRNYVKVEAGRKVRLVSYFNGGLMKHQLFHHFSFQLIPTTLGIVLVHGYLKIDSDLVHPQMRSAVEEQLGENDGCAVVCRQSSSMCESNLQSSLPSARPTSSPF